MNVLQRLTHWLGMTPASVIKPEILAMREALDSGRRAKRTEDYETALESFNRAGELARQMGDRLAVAVIDLHRVDVFLATRQWEYAENTLRDLKHDAQYASSNTQIAYILCSFGVLEQAKGNWPTARQYYEQALDEAKRTRVVGAEARAMGHLADVYLHDGNASYAVHLLREALPKLNASGDIEISSYFVGRLGEALNETGQEIEGGQLIGRALRLAEHMQYHLYERRWRLVLARLAFSAANYQEAFTHYTRALELFKSLPVSLDYVIALCETSRTCLNLHQNQQALDYARQAEKLNETIQNQEAKHIIDGVLGVVLRNMGRGAEAIPYLQSSAGEFDGNLEQIEILRNLAAAQADTEPETAIATYKQAVEYAEKLNALLEVAQTKRDLGLLYAARGKMQLALQEWTAALDIYKAENQPVQTALLYCDIANARRALGQGQRAIKDYEQALVMLNSINDLATRGIVLSNAANAYVDQGDIDSADSFFTESIKIAQKLEDRRAEATRRGNYGWFLLSTGRAQRAEAAVEHALRMSHDLGLQLQVAVQTDNLGLVQDEIGKPDKALPFHQEALETIQQLNNPRWEAIIRSNLANTFVKLNRLDEAAVLFDEVLAVGRSSEDTEIIIRALNGKARIALQQQDLFNVSDLLNQAAVMARKADMRRLLAEALTLQSQYQSLVGQPVRAAELWQEAKRLYTILHASQAYWKPGWLEDKPA